MRCEFKEIGFQDIRFDSRKKGVMFQTCVSERTSFVVQWLGYMTLTHEIRVQFPAREP